jgi:hypothetical protein
MITDIFWHHSVLPSEDLITSTLSKLTLEETVTAESLADDEIDCCNFRSSGSRPRPAAATAAEDDTMVLVVLVVVNIVECVEV